MVEKTTGSELQIITKTEGLSYYLGPANQNDNVGVTSAFNRWVKLKLIRKDEG